MTPELVHHFNTFGYVHRKALFTASEMSRISDAFDRAMALARGSGAENHPHTGYDVVPFFDCDPDAFYPLLDDPRVFDVFEALLGPDFMLAATAGVIHADGREWHHDTAHDNSIAPEGLVTMRAAFYLDVLGPEDGCLNVLPGSHLTQYRQALVSSIDRMGVSAKDIPGMVPLRNHPGDVIFMNHKLFHSALTDRPGRRVIQITCFPNVIEDGNPEHFDWLVGYLDHLTKQYGRMYSDRLLRTAGPRRKRMLARAIDLGFGTTGRLTGARDAG